MNRGICEYCGKTFDITKKGKRFCSHACGVRHNNIKIMSRVDATNCLDVVQKKTNTKIGIIRKTKAIRLLQISLKNELISIIKEIDETLHPEKYETRSWIEKKYPVVYPSLSAEFQRWERGKM